MVTSGFSRNQKLVRAKPRRPTAATVRIVAALLFESLYILSSLEAERVECMLTAKICPNCGGRIDLATYKCQYCDTQFYRDGEEDLVEYGYDNDFNPQRIDGDYATVATQTQMRKEDICRFEQDVTFRNHVAEELAANLANALVRYMYFNIADSAVDNETYIRGYLKVKRYSASQEADILKKFRIS